MTSTPAEARPLADISILLRAAADLAEIHWSSDPNGPGICSLLSMAASDDGRRPDTTDLWDAVVTHLNEEMTATWERRPGRTRAEVASMLRAAAVVAGDGQQQ